MTLIHRIDFNPANQSAFGTLETGELTPVIQGDFVYGLNTQIWQYTYTFTVTTPGTPPAAGDLYSNNNAYFTILYSVGTTLIAYGSAAPAASGNLVRVTGTGTTPIAFSAFTTSAGMVIGTGAAIDTNASRLRIQCGTAAAGYAYIQTKRPVRYRAGQGTTARFTPLFTAGAANNIQLWGMGTIVNNAVYDGYFFGYNGTSFGIAHYIAGTPYWYAQSTDWNGDKVDGSAGSTYTWDKTKGVPVMLKYPFLGYGDIFFYVQNPATGAWILVHTIQYANSTATTQLTNPTMLFTGYTLNSGNTTNKTMYCASIGVFISGVRSFVGNPKWGADNSKDSINTTETAILSIRNCTSYNGVANRGLIRLNSMSIGTKEATVSTVRLKIGATLAGTPAFAARSGTVTDTGVAFTLTSANSIASIDTAGTTVTGGTYVFNTTVGGSGSETIDLTNQDIFIAPGETLTISGVATGNTTIGVSVNWSEDI